MTTTAYQEPTAHAERELRARARWERQCREEVRRCLEGHEGLPGPLYWLYNFTESFDEKWQEHGADGPYRRFPRKPYFPWLFKHFLTDRRLFVPKSREMLTSWSFVAFGVWMCQFFPRQRVMLQGEKESKVGELIKGTQTPGYARTLIERQPDWLRERYPLADKMDEMAATVIAWRNGSSINGVPAGPSQVRSFHPSLLIVDEAAHIDDFEAIYGAADPVSAKIICVSSAAPGFFGDLCNRALTGLI